MKSEYLYVAIGVVFLTVIVGLLVPDGKLKKSVNFVLRLVCICVLVNPIINLFDIEDKIGEVKLDYEYVCLIYSKNQSECLSKMITETLGFDCSCSVAVVYDDGKIKENGVSVTGDFSLDDVTKILEYLTGLGYIDITVNDTCY